MSGEGLIYHVRDPSSGKTRKGARASQEMDEDYGVTDKRLLVVETEFAKVLKAMSRDSNTLSEVMRQCWDTRRPWNNVEEQREIERLEPTSRLLLTSLGPIFRRTCARRTL